MKVTAKMRKLAEREFNGHCLCHSSPDTWFTTTRYMQRVEPKPLSDYLEYETEKENNEINKREQFYMLSNRERKHNQITTWTALIQDLSNQITEINADSTLSTNEKQRKIARRTDIISLYEKQINDAKNILGICVTKNTRIH